MNPSDRSAIDCDIGGDREGGRDRVGAERERRRAARLPVIDPGRCTGCGWCVPTCAPRLLSLEVVQWKKTSVLRGAEQCTGCGLCAAKCPFAAIAMRRETPQTGHAPNDHHKTALMLDQPPFTPPVGIGDAS